MGCAVTGEDVANNTYTATPLYEQALQWFYNNYELMHNYNIQPLFKKNKKNWYSQSSKWIIGGFLRWLSASHFDVITVHYAHHLE